LVALLAGESQSRPGSYWTDEAIKVQMKSILTAGTDTTAALLAWTLYLLAHHPDVEARLQTEIDGQLHGRQAAFDDLVRLPYTKQVLTEALRLYPPAWLLSRTTTREIELDGHVLSPGADVLIVPYLLHREPTAFPDPERFDPDRWRPQHITPAQREAFIAMGSGRRKCIGDVFAMTEAAIALSTIVCRWRLRPSTTKSTKASLGIVLHPAGLRMTVHTLHRDCP
jgi:cytochrome P450